MLLCFTKDIEIFVLTCRGRASHGGEEVDNERKSCVYLLLSKIRSGRLSISFPALFAGCIHFNEMNSGE